MIQTNSVKVLIHSLDALITSLGKDILDLSLLSPAEISEDARLFSELGYWGLLPIIRNADGDDLALYPLPQKPIAAWPVVIAYHNGDGARTLCSGLHALVASCMVYFRYWELSPDELDPALPALEKLAAALGDTGQFAAVRDAIRKGKLNGDNYKSAGYALADPGSDLPEFYRTFRQLIAEGQNPLLIWKGFAEARSHFLPGWKLFLHGGMGKNEIHPLAVKAAWRIVTDPYFLDNRFTFDEVNFGKDMDVLSQDLTDDEIHLREERIAECTWSDDDPILEAASLLLKDDEAAEAVEYEPLMIPALRELTRDRDYDGAAHFAAAQEMEKAGKLMMALDIYQNAAWFHSIVHEAAHPGSIEGAMRVARALQDPDFEDVIRLSLPE